jgi:hypothetical protein
MDGKFGGPQICRKEEYLACYVLKHNRPDRSIVSTVNTCTLYRFSSTERALVLKDRFATEGVPAAFYRLQIK